jgi:hypothetical protein
MKNFVDPIKNALRPLRRDARRGAAVLRWGRALGGSPALFANSFPKSGTHLLTQVLESFPRIGLAVDSGLPAVVMYTGDSGRARPLAEILADLERFSPGDIGYGHLHAIPEVAARLCSPDFAAYFILRDPRDVVVSHVHYVTDMAPGHIHHDYYKNELKTFDERLSVSILGRPEVGIEFPHIRARFEPFLGWLERPEILSLRYEDFLEDRNAALRRVLDHAMGRGFALMIDPAKAIQILAAGIAPQRSPTFRSGKSGGWRAVFTNEHRRQFKDVSGDLLIRLGYEANMDW